MPAAGEVVALAARSVDPAVRGRVAHAVPAVAVASAAAGALLCRAPAGAGAQGALLALAAWPHVPRAAGAHPALEGAFPSAALGAVGLRLCPAAAAALRINVHFQRVAEPHWFDRDVPFASLAGGEAHGHVERHLEHKRMAAARGRLQDALDAHAEHRTRGWWIPPTAPWLIWGKMNTEQPLCPGALNWLDFMSL